MVIIITKITQKCGFMTLLQQNDVPGILSSLQVVFHNSEDLQ